MDDQPNHPPAQAPPSILDSKLPTTTLMHNAPALDQSLVVDGNVPTRR